LFNRGFTVGMLADLVWSGLATGHRETVRVGYRKIKVARIRITDAGRRVLDHPSSVNRRRIHHDRPSSLQERATVASVKFKREVAPPRALRGPGLPPLSHWHLSPLAQLLSDTLGKRPGRHQSRSGRAAAQACSAVPTLG
jgi:hypothetical protein